MDFYFVDGAISHFGKKACLVLGATGQSLSCDVTVFEAAAWVTSEGENDVTTSSCYDLVRVVDWKGVSIVCDV